MRTSNNAIAHVLQRSGCAAAEAPLHPAPLPRAPVGSWVRRSTGVMIRPSGWSAVSFQTVSGFWFFFPAASGSMSDAMGPSRCRNLMNELPTGLGPSG
jgi:hypothetical protein